MAAFFVRKYFRLSTVLALSVLTAAAAQKREFVVKHADRFLYERSNRITRLLGNVEIEHEGMTLTSKTAVYREELEIIEFEEEVRAVEPGRELTAARLVYHVPDSLALAMGNVVVVDRDRSITLQGDSLRHHRSTGNYHLTGRPRFRKSGKQELDIRSRTMDFRDEEMEADFTSDVRIVADSLTILCQRCKYFDRENRLIIQGDPVAFESNNILTGREMEVGLVDEEIRWVKVIENAEGLYLESGTDRALPGGQSWVRGDTLIMYLAEGRIDRMQVIGNAESYYRPGETEGGGEAVNRAIGNRIIIDFQDQEISQVFVKEHTEGTYFQKKASTKAE